MPTPPELSEIEITLLLQQHRAGDETALPRLMPFIYGELKRLAQLHLHGRHPSWQPTRLVHEVFLHVFGGELPHWPQWNDREHFFNTISRQMRYLLIDAARHQQALKRGGEQVPLSLDEAMLTASPRVEVLPLYEALQALERDYPRAARIVELRYFFGFEVADIARALGVTERTVRRDWAFAKSWLLQYLRPKANRG